MSKNAYFQASNRNDKRRYTTTRYRRLRGTQWKITEQKQLGFIFRSYEKKVAGEWVFISGSRRDVRG